MASRVIGCGGYLPEKVITNDDLSAIVDTSDEWIKARTGITQRHRAAPTEFSSHMAYKASIIALADAGINASEIDLVIVSSTTPDNSFPGVANKLHGCLGLKDIPSFDLQAICSGFIYGLHIADSMLKSGKYKTVLFVCTDKMSSLLDWQDRSTCILFGDGAGAVILQNDESDSGIIDSNIYSDGSMYDILHTDGGVSSSGTAGYIRMKGQEVFKQAVEKMSSSVQNIVTNNNLKLSDIDYLISHQANLRIINNIAARLHIPQEKVVTTVQTHANCSAASIPLALFELKKLNVLKEGDMLAFSAFGAGTTWGAALLRW